MRNLLSIVLVFCCFISYSQKDSANIDTLIVKYNDYFKSPRETVFTHFNKTSFVLGENMWFKTYVRDRHLDKKSIKTSNIHIRIYDTFGQLVKNDVWLATNGTAYGSVLIDSSFTVGDYYVKTSTNWMRNFDENDAFVQKVSILGNDSKPKPKTIVTDTLDIQFLPEGGHIVAHTTNVIGFKVLNPSGKGVPVSGKIYDNEDKEITIFKSNKFGIGKFLLNPENGRSYRAELDLPHKITRRIEGVKSRGITLQSHNLGVENLIITINTNTETLSETKDNIYYITLHKNGVIKSMPFSFGDETTKTFTFLKKDLFKDVNIITIFNKNGVPIVERLIFNENFNTSKALYQITKIRKDNDSLVLSFYGMDKESTKGLSDLSISVLPATTRAYGSEHNILSANYLQPYIKGTIESPSYYFKSIDRKKRYDLDILLLTQGWSRYSWEQIFTGPPEQIHSFENGMTLQGRVVKPKNIDFVKLQLPKLMSDNWQDIPLMNDNTFRVENLYPLKGEQLKISYLNDNNKYSKPSLTATIIPNKYDDKLLSAEIIRDTKYKLNSINLPDYVKENFFLFKETQVLDEVVVKANLKKDNTKQINIPNFGNNGAKYTQVTEEDTRSYQFLPDFLVRQGINVNQAKAHAGYFDIPSAIVFIDNVLLSDHSILAKMQLSDVEGVHIKRNTLGYGSRAGNKTMVVRVYSRKTPLYKKSKSNTDYAYTLKVGSGFSVAKEFYNPPYRSYIRDFFKYYGTISWLPNVTLKHDESYFFKILDTQSEIINFYIEGYDSNGYLVSQVVSLKDN